MALSAFNAFYMHRMAYRRHRGWKVGVAYILGTAKIENDFLLCSWRSRGGGGGGGGGVGWGFWFKSF